VPASGGTAEAKRRLFPMDTKNFEPPVGIYFGKMGQTCMVNSLREAAECLMSDRWPSHSGEAFEDALLTLIAVSEGRKPIARAREAFVEAAKEAGILVERKLMTH
jgi:hypothetical protein